MNEKLICPICGAEMKLVSKEYLSYFGMDCEGAGCDECGNFFFIAEKN